MTADVSVVIPCYNDEAWIGDAIESCLEQTMPVREIIVVDDGSSDGTCEVVRKFGDRVHLIKGAHKGGAAARNTGWHAAQGRFVQFLDSDDLLDSDKVRIHYPLACASDPLKLPFCSARVIEMDSGALRYVSEHELEAHPLEHVYFGLNSPIMPMYPRAALEHIGGFTEGLKNCQDRDLNFRLWIEGYDLVPVPHTLVTIRQRARSVSSSVSACLLNYLTVFEKAARGEGRASSPEVHRLTARLFSGAARSLIQAGHYQEAGRFHEVAAALDAEEAEAAYGRQTRMLLRLGGPVVANLPLLTLQRLKLLCAKRPASSTKKC